MDRCAPAMGGAEKEGMDVGRQSQERNVFVTLLFSKRCGKRYPPTVPHKKTERNSCWSFGFFSGYRAPNAREFWKPLHIQVAKQCNVSRNSRRLAQLSTRGLNSPAVWNFEAPQSPPFNVFDQASRLEDFIDVDLRRTDKALYAALSFSSHVRPTLC